MSLAIRWVAYMKFSLFSILMCLWQIDHNNYILFHDTFTVLASLIFKSMEIVNMVPRMMHLAARGVPKGSWRNHF